MTRKLTGIGKYMNVLLADRPISTLLGSRQAASADSGDIFRVSQLYLAQTAMIAAEQPATVRPIVVAPPRRWNPPRRLASGLLADTVAAPWLTPMTANQLATMRPEHQYPDLTTSASKGEISGGLLKQVGQLEKKIALLHSIQVHPDPDLNRAVFAIESSAWRGRAGKHAKALLKNTWQYVRNQLDGLSIRGSSGKHSVLHVTFGGKSSSVPVAIFNNLHYPVLVRLRVTATNAHVSGTPRTIRIPPREYSPSVKITISLARNTRGRITLSLTSPNGRPLPAYPLAIVVHKTDLGIIALIIGSAGLALFVIASAMRAIRAGRPAPPAPAAGAGDSPEGPEPGRTEPAVTEPAVTEPAVTAPEAIEPADLSSPGHIGHNAPHPHQLSLTSAETDAQGLVQRGSRPEHVDSVGANGSGLASAALPLPDQETTPGRPGNREHR